MNTLASALTLAVFATGGLAAAVVAVASEGERVEAMSAVADSQPERLIDVAAHLKTRVSADARAQVKDTVVEVAKEAVDAASDELHRAVDKAAQRSLDSVKARLDREFGGAAESARADVAAKAPSTPGATQTADDAPATPQ